MGDVMQYRSRVVRVVKVGSLQLMHVSACLALLVLIGCDAQKGGERAYVDSGAPPTSRCATTMCHRDALCSDGDEGPTCACKPGYDGDGFACTDIDECESGAAHCDDNATCTNTAGSFTCTCNAPAWQGNGQTCSDANECADNTDNCSANATCINTVGSFDCECALSGDDDDAGVDDAGIQHGDAGVGMDGGVNNSCRDIDECANDLDDCDVNATCINNNDGFTCACKPGYVATGNSAGHGANGCTFAYCDLTGRWAVKTELVVSWDNVRFNNGDAVVLCSGTRVPTYAWELREFAYDGETLTMKSKGCGSSDTPLHNLEAEKVARYIPYSMFDAIDLRAQPTRDIALPSENVRPGQPFMPPYEAIVFGMRIPEPENPDAWPTAAALPATRICSDTVGAPCWEDDDSDPVAAPGYTTWSKSQLDAPTNFYTLPFVNAFDRARRGACYTLGSRTISRFHGAYESCDRISGTIDVMAKSNGQPAIDARLQGCKVITDITQPFDCYDPVQWNAMSNCTIGELTTLNRQTIQRHIDDSSFEMVRVPDNTECPDVRSMFPVTTPTRDYCECGDPCANHVAGCPAVDPEECN